jgi:hypothetical protein
MQDDLLQAADEITENMSELVRELEREEERRKDDERRHCRGFYILGFKFEKYFITPKA